MDSFISTFCDEKQGAQQRAAALAELERAVDETWFLLADHADAIAAAAGTAPDPPAVHALLARTLYLSGAVSRAASHALAADGRIPFCEPDPLSSAITHAVMREYTAARRAGTEPAAGAAAVFRQAVEPEHASSRLIASGLCVEAYEWELLSKHLAAAPAEELPAIVELLNDYVSADPTCTSPAVRRLGAVVCAALDSRPSAAAAVPQLVAADFRAAAAAEGGASAAALGDFVELLGSGRPESFALACQLASDRAAGLLPAQAEAAAASLLTDLEEIFPGDSRVSQLARFQSGAAARTVFENHSLSASQIDTSLLNAIRRGSVSVKNVSVVAAAAALANGVVSGRTGSNCFLEDNQKWMADQGEWSAFRTTASLGSIIAGQTVPAALTQLSAFLPFRAADGGFNAAPPQMPYVAAGALYALGIVAAGAPPCAELDRYLTHVSAQTLDGTLITGLLLAVGLAYISGARDEAGRRGASPAPAALVQWVNGQLHATAGLDVAQAGLAAGLAVGLLNMGGVAALKDNATDMAAKDALETLVRPPPAALRHPLLRLGFGLGSALLCYGAGEAADDVVADLAASRHPETRAGGAYALGMSHIGTGSLTVIHRLLGEAVREAPVPAQAATTAVGFVCCAQPELAIRTLAQLSRSYNPAVRAGCAMGLALASAGTVAAAPTPGEMQRESDRLRAAVDRKAGAVGARGTSAAETGAATRGTGSTLSGSVLGVAGPVSASAFPVDFAEYADAEAAEAALVAAATAGELKHAIGLIEPLLLGRSPAAAYATNAALGLLLQGRPGTEQLPFIAFSHKDAERKKREQLERYADAARKQDIAKRDAALKEGSALPNQRRREERSSAREILVTTALSTRAAAPIRAGAAVGAALMYGGGQAGEFCLTTHGRANPLAAVAGMFFAISQEWFSLALLMPAATRPAAPIAVLPDETVPIQLEFELGEAVSTEHLAFTQNWEDERKVKRAGQMTLRRAELTGEQAKEEAEAEAEAEQAPVELVHGHKIHNGERLPTSAATNARLRVASADMELAIPGRLGGLLVVYSKE